MALVTIAGFEVYPERAIVVPFVVGNPTIRRSLNGTGYQKDVGEKQRVTLSWSVLDAEEMQTIKVIWQQTRQTSTGVSITCSDPAISGNFLRQGSELQFEPLDGSTTLYRGTLIFEER